MSLLHTEVHFYFLKTAFTEVQPETFQDRCLDLWTKLSISRHCQLRNIPHESYGSQAGPGPFKITFAHHFAELDSLQLQPYLSGTDCANKSKQFVGEGLGFFLLWLVVLLEISRNPNSRKHKNIRELEKTHGTHFITFSDKGQAEVSSASLGNPNGKCQCPVKVSD